MRTRVRRLHYRLAFSAERADEGTVDSWRGRRWVRRFLGSEVRVLLALSLTSGLILSVQLTPAVCALDDWQYASHKRHSISRRTGQSFAWLCALRLSRRYYRYHRRRWIPIVRFQSNGCRTLF
jgi:hypothetical protein